MVGDGLHTYHLAQVAVDGQSVAEADVVQRLGVHHVYTVELFLCGIDGDTVGRVADVAEEVELLRYDASSPPYGHPFVGAGVVVELQFLRLDAHNLARPGQMLLYDLH